MSVYYCWIGKKNTTSDIAQIVDFRSLSLTYLSTHLAAMTVFCILTALSTLLSSLRILFVYQFMTGGMRL